jgi:hypothetical protein
MVGEGPGDGLESWPEALGPFVSESQAKKAIRDDIYDTVETWDEFSTGKHPDWCEQYTILEVVKSFRPCLDITAKVTLPEIPPHQGKNANVQRPADATSDPVE